MNTTTHDVKHNLIRQLRSNFPFGEVGVVDEEPLRLRVAISFVVTTQFNILNNVSVWINLSPLAPFPPATPDTEPLMPLLRQIETCKIALDNSLYHKNLTRKAIYNYLPTTMLFSYHISDEEMMAIGFANGNMEPIPYLTIPCVRLSRISAKRERGAGVFRNRLNSLLAGIFSRAEWLTTEGVRNEP